MYTRIRKNRNSSDRPVLQTRVAFLVTGQMALQQRLSALDLDERRRSVWHRLHGHDERREAWSRQKSTRSLCRASRCASLAAPVPCSLSNPHPSPLLQRARTGFPQLAPFRACHSHSYLFRCCCCCCTALRCCWSLTRAGRCQSQERLARDKVATDATSRAPSTPNHPLSPTSAGRSIS